MITTSHPAQKHGIKSTLLALLLVCMIPFAAHAQMFSVDNDNTDYSIPDIGIYVGAEPMSFEYQGEERAGGQSEFYEFDGTLLRLMLEGRGLTITMGTGGSTTGIDSVTYFDAGIQFGYGFTAARTPDFNLIVPIQLHSTITRVTNDQIVAPNIPDFDQGTLELAGGFKANAKLATNMRFSTGLMPSYGLSFSTRQRDATGSIFGLEGTFRLYFDKLFGNAGLSAGYNYDYRSYDIDENSQLLDYRARAHSFLIGVTF